MPTIFRYLLLSVLFITSKSLLLADGQLVNGDFSSPSVSGVQTFYGPYILPGWTITQGSVDVVNLASQPGFAGDFESNTQAADLNGYTGYTPADAATMYQDVATTPGDLYTFTFGLAANTAGPPLVKSMNILWGSSSGSLSVVGSYNASLATFTTYALTVKAASNLSRLELVSTTDSSSSWGPYITFDPITEVAIPEPSTSWLISLGVVLVLLAALSRRLRKKTN